MKNKDNEQDLEILINGECQSYENAVTLRQDTY
jgi:hypothetical protein